MANAIAVTMMPLIQSGSDIMERQSFIYGLFCDFNYFGARVGIYGGKHTRFAVEARGVTYKVFLTVDNHICAFYVRRKFYCRGKMTRIVEVHDIESEQRFH